MCSNQPCALRSRLQSPFLKSLPDCQLHRVPSFYLSTAWWPAQPLLLSLSYLDSHSSQQNIFIEYLQCVQHSASAVGTEVNKTSSLLELIFYVGNKVKIYSILEKKTEKLENKLTNGWWMDRENDISIQQKGWTGTSMLHHGRKEPGTELTCWMIAFRWCAHRRQLERQSGLVVAESWVGMEINHKWAGGILEWGAGRKCSKTDLGRQLRHLVKLLNITEFTFERSEFYVTYTPIKSIKNNMC